MAGGVTSLVAHVSHREPRFGWMLESLEREELPVFGKKPVYTADGFKCTGRTRRALQEVQKARRKEGERSNPRAVVAKQPVRLHLVVQEGRCSTRSDENENAC